MTRLPLDSWDITGIDGGGYVANAVCAAPHCDLVVGERHHLWRRSFLSGDFWWVCLPDGVVVGNVVFLCQHHHQLITENKAKIELSGNEFVWVDANGIERLGWQPPWFTDMEAFTSPKQEIRDSKTPGKENGEGSHVCPECGQRIRERAEKREPAKFRKSWSIYVPVAELENGAEVLDVNLEHARHLFNEAGLSYGAEDTAKYYVLSTALALFIANAEAILTSEGG
jgi:hypothetical protein